MPCENLRLDLAERQVLLRDEPAGFLNYLHCFPVDILKLDRFFSRMGDTGEDAALEQTVVILSLWMSLLKARKQQHKRHNFKYCFLNQ